MVNNLEIISLAHQCPLVFGKAVYLARSLYSLFSEDNAFDDELICDGYYKKEKASFQDVEQSEAWLRIFPNPAKEQTLLAYHLPLDAYSSADLVVRSVDGRVLHTQTIMPGGSSVTLNVRQIPSGVYVVELWGDEALIKASKLIVNH